MMVWFLALVLLASLAGIGFRQGAIRVAFAFVGIVMGALLAGLLAKPVKALLITFGLKTPALAWLLAPVVAFLIISIIFKIAGYMVHQKVDVHFKYKAGDLRLALWERLNRRLGLCLALVNGALYLILIATVIYPLSYWTYQLASSQEDPRAVKILNGLGKDLQTTGFAKVARALDPMPKLWYDSADLAGLLYSNPLIDARVSRYPAFLGLAERPEFQDMAKDTEWSELRLRQAPIMKMVDQPKTQAIIQNPELLKLIWATVVPDMTDLQTYLVTGKSPKYGAEKILGRWTFNVSVAMALFRQAKPNTTSKEMQNWKRWMVAAFSKTTFVAMTDHQAILKEVPQLKAPAAGAISSSGPQTLKGDWKGADGKYQLNLSGASRDEQLAATVEGERLTVAGQGIALVFDRED
jgi:hypothetical protein